MSVFLLLGSVFAQGPATFTVRPTGIDLTNSGSKEIVFIALKVTLTDGRSGEQTHDYYFEPAVVPGNTVEVVHDDPNFEPYAKADLLFLQFADGTTWGSDDHAQEVIGGRKSKLDFVNRMLGAFSSGGDSSLSDALSTEAKEPRSAKYFKNMMTQGGSGPVVSRLQDDLTQARKRLF